MTLAKGRIFGTVAMTTAVQTLTAFAIGVASVLAPVAAPDLDVPPAQVGTLVSVFFLTAIVSGLLSGALSRRFGPIRTLRGCVLLIAIALLTGAGNHVVLVIAYAMLAGIAHGIVNPVSSLVLAQAVPGQMRSLMFSIKQTGVPLGSAIAGLLLPLLLLAMSWQAALVCVGIASLFLMLALRPFYALFDRGRDRGAALTFGGVGESFRDIFRNPDILQVVLAATIFAVVQTAVTTFLVTYLNLELGYSLIAAGVVFSLQAAASVLGRVFWGWVADRTGNAMRVLSVLGMVMGGGCIAAGLFSPDSPSWFVMLVSILLGMSAVSWNGVLLAEVARLSPQGRIAGTTSAAQAIFFSGSLFGLPLFGAAVGVMGGFAVCYLWLAPLPILSAILLLRCDASNARRNRAES